MDKRPYGLKSFYVLWSRQSLSQSGSAVIGALLVLCLSGLREPGHLYAVNILTSLMSAV